MLYVPRVVPITAQTATSQSRTSRRRYLPGVDGHTPSGPRSKQAQRRARTVERRTPINAGTRTVQTAQVVGNLQENQPKNIDTAPLAVWEDFAQQQRRCRTDFFFLFALNGRIVYITDALNLYKYGM